MFLCGIFSSNPCLSVVFLYRDFQHVLFLLSLRTGRCWFRYTETENTADTPSHTIKNLTKALQTTWTDPKIAILRKFSSLLLSCILWFSSLQRFPLTNFRPSQLSNITIRRVHSHSSLWKLHDSVWNKYTHTCTLSLGVKQIARRDPPCSKCFWHSNVFVYFSKWKSNIHVNWMEKFRNRIRTACSK